MPASFIPDYIRKHSNSILSDILSPIMPTAYQENNDIPCHNCKHFIKGSSCICDLDLHEVSPFDQFCDNYKS